MKRTVESKIRSREEALVIVQSEKASGKKVGFTSGVFDLVHAGHVEYLQESRRNCDFLVVAINSDASVKKSKGDKRPVCPEEARTSVVAAFEFVDLVFVFEEKNNNSNIEILKPDIYIKAGDYSKEKLSSGSIVESYGGKVLLMPFKSGYSSTGIINRILEIYSDEMPQSLAAPSPEKRPAVFLDRDGTVNEHVEYLHEVSKFRIIPGALDAIKNFNNAGFRVVLITNQPGIGMGYFTREDFFLVNKEMLKACGKVGALVDRVYFCPHSKAEKCSCRKPNTVLLERAVKDLNIDIEKSFFIGDTTLDIMTGRNAGIRTILVKTGMKGEDGIYEVEPDFTADNLLKASELVLQKGK